MIFPEGTRRPPGAPPDYKPGYLALYEGLGLPCVPLALNSGLFWPRRSFVRYPGTIVIEILDPIAAGLPRAQARSLIQERIETATDRLFGKPAPAPIRRRCPWNLRASRPCNLSFEPLTGPVARAQRLGENDAGRMTLLSCASTMPSVSDRYSPQAGSASRAVRLPLHVGQAVVAPQVHDLVERTDVAHVVAHQLEAVPRHDRQGMLLEQLQIVCQLARDQRVGPDIDDHRHAPAN